MILCNNRPDMKIDDRNTPRYRYQGVKMLQNKMTGGRSSIPSQCGKFVAVTSTKSPIVEIYSISTASSRLHRTYDLGQLAIEHLRKNTEEALKPDESFFNIGMLKWEHVLSGSASTKVGIVLDRLSMLVVLDIRDEADPIFIQQTSQEGIESFRWIAPVLEKVQNGTEEPGAYTNSIQILLFTKSHLKAKLFSLDCTHMLWSIEKPVSDELFIRPGLKNSIWSLVANSLISITSDSTPIMYHFYNEGSISNLLYKFRLASSAPYTRVSWSDSGKWFYDLNFVDNLFGFELKVYNALGIYRNQFNQLTEVPQGDPIISIDYLNKGIVDRQEDSSLISFGSMEYLSQWIQTDASNAEYILIVGAKIEDDTCKLELILVSIKSFGIINRSIIPNAPIYNIWKQFREPSTNSIRYRKSLNKSLLLKKDCKLGDFRVQTSKDGTFASFQVEDILLLYKILIEDDLPTNKNVQYEFVTAIHVKSKVLSLKLFQNIREETKLFIITDDHIASYGFTNDSLEIIYPTTVSTNIKDAFFFKQEEAIELVITHDINNHINWLVLAYEDDVDNFLQHSGPEDDSNLSLMKRFHYNEENPKVVGLMKDVQHSEWGQGLRIKRNRFNFARLSLLGNIDDVTDTFNLQKKSKR